MQSISFIKQTVSEEKIFEDFFENLSFLGPRQLLNKQFSKNKTQISQMRKQKFAISTFFHYKSMGRIKRYK